MGLPFHTHLHGKIAELVIDHPPVNALDSAGWLALAKAIDDLGQEPDSSVILIRAEGRGFCAGVDIKEMAAHPERIVELNAGNYRHFQGGAPQPETGDRGCSRFRAGRWHRYFRCRRHS